MFTPRAPAAARHPLLELIAASSWTLMSFISLILPFVISLVLIVPSTLPQGAFIYRNDGEVISIGGTGYSTNGTAPPHAQLLLFDLPDSWPKQLHSLPPPLLVQFVLGLALLLYSIILTAITLVERRRAKRDPFRKDFNSFTGLTSWITLIAVLLTCGILAADLGVFLSTREALEDTGVLELGPAGYTILYAGGDLTLMWLIVWGVVVVLRGWRVKRAERMSLAEEEPEFMPDKVEYEGDRVKLSVHVP